MKRLLTSLAAGLLTLSSIFALPQDNWFKTPHTLEMAATYAAITDAGQILGLNNTHLALHDSKGNQTHSIVHGILNPRALIQEGNYAYIANLNGVSRFTLPDLNEAPFTTPITERADKGVAIRNGILTIRATTSLSYKRFDSEGTLVETLPAVTVAGPYGGDVTLSSGSILEDAGGYFWMASNLNSQTTRLYLLSPAMTYITYVTAAQSGRLSASNDGRVYHGASNGVIVFTRSASNTITSHGKVISTAAYGANAGMMVTAGNPNPIYYQTYRTFGEPEYNLLPQVNISAISQRPNSTVLDIDFALSDVDTPNARIVAFALEDGVVSLDNLIPLSVANLVDSTSNIYYTQIATNQSYRLSWNIGADWPVDQGSFEVNVMAQDDRAGLLDLHFLHIPTNGDDLVINRTPIDLPQLLEVWFWLIGTQDSRLAYDGSRILGTEGIYAGVELASGINTTEQGRAFLFELMGVHEATAEEIQVAREATVAGNVNQWTPTLQVTPVNTPETVNEFGFDTGDYGENAWWVIKNAE